MGRVDGQLYEESKMVSMHVGREEAREGVPVASDSQDGRLRLT